MTSLIETTLRRRPQVGGLAPTAIVIGVGAALAFAAAFSPRTVLEAVVALFAIAVFSMHPQGALVVFVATIPLEYQFQLNGSGTLTITKVAGALCFASFALNAMVTRRKLVLDGTHAIVGALLVLALTSTAFAESLSDGVSATIRYASWALLFFVVTQFPGDRAMLRRLVWGLVLSGGAAGAFGCYNFLTGITSLATVRYGQQNDYAFVLAAVLPLAVWLVLTTRLWQRYLAVVATGLVVAGIVLSFSRGAWLAVAASFVLFAALHRQHALRLVIVAAAATVVTSLFITANPSRVKEGNAAKQVVSQANVDSRLTLYRGAVTLMVDNPLVGVGPGNFGRYFYRITGAPPGTPPLLVVHDTYLEVAAELGLPGFALFIAFLFLALTRVSVAAREGRGPPELAAFVRASLLAVMIGSLTLSEEFFAPVWLVGALATVLYLERSCASST